MTSSPKAARDAVMAEILREANEGHMTKADMRTLAYQYRALESEVARLKKGKEGREAYLQDIIDTNARASKEWAEKAHETEDRTDALKARLAEAVRLSSCHVIHLGYPRGTSCLDVREHARKTPEKYGDTFREELLRGKHLCQTCQIRDALSSIDSDSDPAKRGTHVAPLKSRQPPEVTRPPIQESPVGSGASRDPGTGSGTRPGDSYGVSPSPPACGCLCHTQLLDHENGEICVCAPDRDPDDEKEGMG